MSRRRILVLATVASAGALALVFCLPELFSPVPGLVMELKSCLVPTGETLDCDAETPDSPQAIQT